MKPHEAQKDPRQLHGTTILALRRRGEVVMIGDGQATSYRIAYRMTKKVMTMDGGKVLFGYSGVCSDCEHLREKFQSFLTSEHNPNRCPKKAARDCVLWYRRDTANNTLYAHALVASRDHILSLTGEGALFEAEDDIEVTGSGGDYALTAALALMKNTSLSAEQIAKKAMAIAAETCPYTNDNFTFVKVKKPAKKAAKKRPKKAAKKGAE